MSARNYIYSQLCSIPSIDLIGGVEDPRIFAKKTMTSAYEDHPFIVFKLGVDSHMDLSEDTRYNRQYFQVWVHDVNTDDHADYGRIDDLLMEIKEVFHLANSPDNGVFSSEFLETSQDFNDDTLNTLFKYSRFTLIKNDRLT